MNIPSIESLYATIEQQQRVIKQAHEDIAKLTAERDRFANMISESSNRWQEMMFALREAKEALEICLAEIKMWRDDYDYEDFNSPFVNSAIATINKVLGEE